MDLILALQSGAPAALQEPAQIWWYLFFGYAGILLGADLYINRHPHEPSLRQTLIQITFFVANGIGVMFAIWFLTPLGGDGAGQYFASYLTELSLSVDNIFVIALLMRKFAVPRELHHKVLFFGIIGAFVMRFVFITLGLTLIHYITFMLVIFGIFLIVTGVKLFKSDDEEDDPTDKKSVQFINRVIPTVPGFYGGKFFVRVNGKKIATQMLTVVMSVEAVDLLFATDSVPAVMAITNSPFVAFTSNMMAIMGLRAMYFLYAYIEPKITRLNEGLAFILIFIGCKMILAYDALWALVGSGFSYLTDGRISFDHGYHMPTSLSLCVIVLILAISVGASIKWPKKKGTEVNIQQNVAANEVMVELYVDMGPSMDGEHRDGLIDRYGNEVNQQLALIDTDHRVPVFGFGRRVEFLDEITAGERCTFRQLDLGDGSDLAMVFEHARKTAKRTTGSYVFVVLTDGQVTDEQAVYSPFVDMPNNAFIELIRVSDAPGGAELMRRLNEFNIGDADRCHAIEATGDDGQPLESIADRFGTEIIPWLKRRGVSNPLTDAIEHTQIESDQR